MAYNSSLDTKISSLVDEVGELRGELQSALSTLRRANSPMHVMNGLSRAGLLFMKRVLDDNQRVFDGNPKKAKWDSNSLFSCCETAKNAGLLPDEIYFLLGTIRTWSNKASHAVEQVKMTNERAEFQLGILLDVVHWYFCESEHGPHRSFIYRKEEAGTEDYWSALPQTAALSAQRSRGTWPRFPGECVGRQEKMADLRAKLPESRKQILIGGPGYGKTRLAWEYARENEAAYPNGVLFANLTTLPIESDRQILRMYLGPLMQSIAGSDGDGALLVLDNCEHLAGAATEEIQNLSNVFPRLHILGTSRTPLHMLASFPVPALPLPEEMDDEAEAPDAETVESYAAVELFVKRAQLVDPGFRLDGETIAPVVAICRKLAGIPFAIELAAKFIHFRLQDLAESLDEWLAKASVETDLASTDVRHGTVDACIRWSIDLLPAESVRDFLYRASIFRGGFTLDAYRDLVRGLPEGSASHLSGSGAIMELSKHGFVVKDANDFYELPGPVRLFALTQLMKTAEYDSLLASYERWLAAQETPTELLTIGITNEHRDKIHLAIANAEEALRLADRIERDDPRRAAQSRSHRAFYLILSGKMFQGNRLLEQALPYMTDRRRSEVLLGIGMVQYLKNDFEPALKSARESAELAAQEGDIGIQALAAVSQVTLEGFVIGPNPATDRLMEVAMELSGKAGESWTIAYAWLSQATYFWQAGRLEEAERSYAEALTRFASVGDKFMQVFALNSLGHLTRLAGRPAQGVKYYLRSMELSQGLLFERGRCGCVLGTSGVAQALGKDDDAIMFYGAGRRQYDRLGVKMIPPIERCYTAKFEALYEATEEKEPGKFERLYTKGQRLTLPQAFEQARKFLEQAQKTEGRIGFAKFGSSSKM